LVGKCLFIFMNFLLYEIDFFLQKSAFIFFVYVSVFFL